MRVSIEIGHTRLVPGGVFNTLVVQRSIDLGLHLDALLREQEINTHFAVLTDDKELPTRSRDRGVQGLIGMIETQLQVDYFFPEHKLQAYIDALVALLPNAGLRRRVDTKLRDTLKKRGALPCSADIAIWHALRLGLIEDTAHIAIDHDGVFRPSDLIVSILPEADEESETVARDRYLKHMPHDAQGRVHRLFYPNAADEEVFSSGHVVQLANTIVTAATTTISKEPIS